MISLRLMKILGLIDEGKLEEAMETIINLDKMTKDERMKELKKRKIPRYSCKITKEELERSKEPRRDKDE